MKADGSPLSEEELVSPSEEEEEIVSPEEEYEEQSSP